MVIYLGHGMKRWFGLAAAMALVACTNDSDKVERVAPVLVEVLPVATPATSATPAYSFSTTEAGNIVFGGDCSSGILSAAKGINTITLNYLIAGEHSNCTVQVVDKRGKASNVLAISAFTIDTPPVSIAHIWNEALLAAIRKDRARPPIHARNLFHTSAAMYDIWAVYDVSADNYLLGQASGGVDCSLPGLPPAAGSDTAREAITREAISFAMYRMINHRFSTSPGIAATSIMLDALMTQLGYDKNDVATDYSGGSASALGNYVAACYIAYGADDGANEVGPTANWHGNSYYTPVNEPLIPTLPGAQIVADIDRWQPITLDVFVDQAGNVEINGVPPFIGAEWGNVKPFALTDAVEHRRDVNADSIEEVFQVYHDPGVPPSHVGTTATEFLWNFALVSKWSAHLDPVNPDSPGSETIDISPASIGNDPASPIPLPASFAEFQSFYDAENGGDASVGHTLNPKTGLPYAQQLVKRGDFARVLTEFWADGPSSETPPGHWFSVLNYVTSRLDASEKRFGGGAAPVLDDLAWDIQTYFTLGGAMHDAAIAAWSIKGRYDYVRPITIIRSFDVLDPAVEPGFIEIVEPGDPLAGTSGQHVGKYKIKAWKGTTVINNPATEAAGVDWILAENWWPAQRPTFVTPPFAGYVSGHSTFSRAGADIMTAITGDPYFPDGMGEFQVKASQYLVFEDGPTTDITLQWATYRDASDQCSLSRIWGGIHPPFDDIPGRRVGSAVAADAFDHAKEYIEGVAIP